MAAEAEAERKRIAALPDTTKLTFDPTVGSASACFVCVCVFWGFFLCRDIIFGPLFLFLFCHTMRLRNYLISRDFIIFLRAGAKKIARVGPRVS